MMDAQKNSTDKQQVAATDDCLNSDSVHRDVSPAVVRMAASQAEHRAAHRHSMIAAAAYRRAEGRGFTPGHELDDWLNAELEVEAAERLSVLCPNDAITPAEQAAWAGASLLRQAGSS